MSKGRFVGVGVDRYRVASIVPLDHAVEDVRLFRALLGDAFEGEPLADPDELSAREFLRGIRGSLAGEPRALVLMWAGHAVASQTVPLRLLACDSDPDQDGGLDVTGDVASAAAYSGANQLLFLIDTCFSGAAVSAAQVVAGILQARPPNASYVWVGVLSSCLSVETARDGLFGRRVRALLERGPTDPVLKTRWSVHNAFIRGDDLCDAVVKEWASEVQTPQFESNGSAWWMFRNPFFVPGAPEEVVEHLLQAARGGDRRDERSWFTGRTEEVNRVVGWMRSGVPGVYVVAGSAGTGKSAIIGRVVSLSNPRERKRLLDEGRGWDHDDPGEKAVHAHVHARGLTADRAADLLADGLVRCELLAPQLERRNASELVGQVQRAVENGACVPVIVVDGVDEARGEAFSMAEGLILRLAPFAIVIVSSREIRRGGALPSLIATLAPEGPGLDLDEPAVRQRGRYALRDYVAGRLAGAHGQMDADAVANYLAGDAQ